ncbi:MAG: tetratricopeptide repeat protein [Chitinophagales bacterium]
MFFFVLLFSSLNTLASEAPSTLFKKGENALKAGDFEIAAEYFAQFLEAKPDNQAALYNLALSHYNDSNPRLCLENIKQIKYWKKQKRLLSLAVWCAYNSEMKDSARLWLSTVPDGEKNADMLLLKGRLLLPEDPGQSKLILDQALLLDPGLLQTLYYRSKANLALNDTAAALKDLNILLTHRKAAEAYGLRAAIKKSRGDTKGAMEDYQSAFDSDQQVQWKYAQLNLMTEQGNYRQAREIAAIIEKDFPEEQAKIQPIENKLMYLDWINSYWLYGLLALILLLLLLFLFLFRN